MSKTLWRCAKVAESARQTFDVVIGADLVYSFAAVEPFVTALSAVLCRERATCCQILAPRIGLRPLKKWYWSPACMQIFRGR